MMMALMVLVSMALATIFVLVHAAQWLIATSNNFFSKTRQCHEEVECPFEVEKERTDSLEGGGRGDGVWNAGSDTPSALAEQPAPPLLRSRGKVRTP